MISTQDDTGLVKVALSRGFVLEDEVRECRYINSASPNTSIISILRGKGHLSEKDFLYLLRIHADRELRRALKEHLRTSPESYSIKIAKALGEAEVTFAERLRGKRSPGTSAVAETVIVCPKCASKYNASMLAPGTQYKCRKCGNTLEIPDHGTVLEVEPDVELDEAFDTEELVGRIVAGCKIVERIGEGGMGVVYRGKHLTLDRDVAIKVLPRKMTSDFFRERFLAESRAAGKLIHPNVVQVFDAGEERGNPYIVMEYVEGATIKQLINTRKRLGLAFVLRVISEAARGLAAAHRLKLVHRDVKPENIMISFTGDSKVMDFGLAKDVGMEGDVTKAGMLMGTPYYMAPEQFMTDVDVDHRADIYALGVTLYHMLAGRPPYLGDSPYKVMNAHLNERYTPVTELNAKVPEGLVTVLDKMLAKNRKNRYQTMLQVVRDIEHVKVPEEKPRT
jgi:serine/threonine-protein kinase